MSERQSAGGMLEENTYCALKRCFFIQDVINSKEDLHHGTDYFIQDNRYHKTFRMDITFDMKRKMEERKTHLLDKKTIDSDGFLFNVTYGVRTGNRVADFKEPVLVVGIGDDSGYLQRGNLAAEEAYWKICPDIFEDALDQFNHYCNVEEVKKDPLKIGELKMDEQTPDMQLAAAKSVDPKDADELACCLAKPTVEVQMILVEKDPFAVLSFWEPCEEAQCLAVSKNPNLLGELNDPSDKVKKAAELHKDDAMREYFSDVVKPVAKTTDIPMNIDVR